MLSPEHKFQPRIVFAPDNKTGNDTIGPQLESPQQSPRIEAALNSHSYLEALKPHTSAILGLAPELVPPVLESNQSLPLEQLVTIDAEQIRAKRREQFEKTGYIPPIAGGAPKQIDVPINEIVALYRDQHISTAEIAKQFGVSVQTIYKRLHEAGALNLVGTRIGDNFFKQREEESDGWFEQWHEENKDALQKEQEQTREVIRQMFGEEFLKNYEATETAIKELIRKREKKQMKK